MSDTLDLNWEEARGPTLADHRVGDLCKAENGELYLVGHVEEGTNYDGGCGCCSEKITEFRIVMYVPLLVTGKGV